MKHAPEMIDRVLSLYQETGSYRTVAALVSLAPSTCYSIIARNGKPREHATAPPPSEVRALAHKGLSDPQIASALGVKAGLIRWVRELNSIPPGMNFRVKRDPKADSTSRLALSYTADRRLSKWDEAFKELIGEREYVSYVMKGAKP